MELLNKTQIELLNKATLAMVKRSHDKDYGGAVINFKQASKLLQATIEE